MNYLHTQKLSYSLFQITLLLIGGFTLMSFGYIEPNKMVDNKEIVGIFGDKKAKKSKKDAFACKAKKGPNIYSSTSPKTKSRSKLYMHTMSKKRVKNTTNSSVFSATKSRYNLIDTKTEKKKAKVANRGRKTEK